MAKRGAKRRWQSAKALQEAVDQYFEQCAATQQVPCVPGLALHLGFTCRQALDRYTDRSGEETADEIVGIITTAKSRIEMANLQLAYTRDASPGARFVLQNGFNYTDKKEISTRNEIRVELSDDDG